MLLAVCGAATKAVALEISKGVAPSPRSVFSKKTATSENIEKPRVVGKNGQAIEVLRAKPEPKETVSAVPQFAPGLPRWLTDNRAFFDDKPLADYLQPTQSGRLASGLWGCTRNQGKKFHAGVDIKSLHRDRRYVPQDCIFAALPGKVAYINANPKNSAYGNYVVLEHFEPNLRFYTLYAHLASVEPTLEIGQSVEQSTILGVMGCTGNVPGLYYAHVHFEVGLSVGTEQTFAHWYDTQKSKTKDPGAHGKWHAFNPVSLDPLEFFSNQNRLYAFFKSATDCLYIVDCEQQNFPFYGTKHRFGYVAVRKILRLEN